MSASYGWAPAFEKFNSFECNVNSENWKKIIDNFGEFLSEKDLVKLQHFHAATGDEIYHELADLVSKVGSIRIRREY